MTASTASKNREFPFVELGLGEIAAVVSPVLRAQPDEFEVSKLPGFTNSSYKVRHPSQTLLVRVIAGDLNAYLKEYNLLSRYADCLPVPKPLHFSISSAATGGHPVAIHQWIDGQTLEQYLEERPGDSATAAGAVAEVIGQLTNVRFERSAFFSPQMVLGEKFSMNQLGYRDYLTGLMTQSLAGQRLQHLSEPMWRYVQSECRWMDKLPQKYNLVHGEFRADNIIVRQEHGNLKVVGVLDWERAMSWTSWYDVALLLDSSLPKLQEFERELLQSLSSQGQEVPSQWASIRSLLQLLSLCDLLARPAVHPDVAQAAAARINSIIRR